MAINNILVSALLLSCLACAAAVRPTNTGADLAADGAEASTNWWRPFPRFHPRPPFHWPVPFPWGHAFPPMPSGGFKQPPFAADPKALKCLTDFRAEMQCNGEVFASFFNSKVSIGDDCCKTIQEVSDDCMDTVFAHFNNPFFGPLLKAYCAKKA